MSDADPRRDLVACYAAGALDDDERATVERLLDPAAPEFDPELVDELRMHLETLAALAPEVTTPPDLLDRILADLPPQELMATAPTPESRSATVVPFERPAARPRRPRQLIGIAIAAAAVIALVFAGVGLLRNDDDTDLREFALAVMDDPDAQQVTLTSPSGGEAVARAAMLPDGAGFLVVDDLPAPDASESYQLWMLPTDDSAPISLGLVDPDPDGATAFRMSPDAGGIAVSLEPAGGSATPTEVVAAGTVA
jgi:anti-sigma-K factor RskA